jgi:hydroxymethylbilane synthase
MLPAPAQGALAVQCRADDRATLSLLRSIHHRLTGSAVTAERAFLSGLGGGCAAPVAAYADCMSPQGTGGPAGKSNGVVLRLRGLVASLDGRQVVRVAGDGSPGEPEQLGYRLAQEALAHGASAMNLPGRAAPGLEALG